jgi:hypothetical protein
LSIFLKGCISKLYSDSLSFEANLVGVSGKSSQNCFKPPTPTLPAIFLPDLSSKIPLRGCISKLRSDPSLLERAG